MSNITPCPVFTICVPSYNRGNKALNLVLNTLPDMEENWEILVLDNASNLEVEAYQELERIAQIDTRLRYIRHESNRMMHGNFLACFNLANSPYIMIVSDEDFPNTVMIKEVLPLLHEYLGVSILRGSILAVDGIKPKNANLRKDHSYCRGEQALMGFSFTNNYFSGTIYNRSLLMTFGLIDRFAHGLEVNAVYPHLYLELLACAVSDVVTTSMVSCFEGPDQLLEENTPNQYKPPYSFGSRVDQFIILRNGVWEAVGLVSEQYDNQLFAKLYLRLCEKYMFLITIMNSNLYIKNRLHTGLLHQSMLYICGAAISMQPEIAEIETEVFEKIQKLYIKYEPFK